ncbi:phage integrase SAM-like domain-containing protein [Lacihabitans lacunae]|jgi:integrase|uniref:Phage integrase SAM-like domain-containing protein n=1 Tax=Lacihabitans lacunae TaxID=1028214 RepID=A0ABV7YQY1_9BACT
MATINFIIQTAKKPSQIYVRVKEGSQVDIKAKTPFFINPEDWSTIKKQPKNLKDAEGKKIFLGLQELKNSIMKEINEVNGHTILNSEWLYKIINPVKFQDSKVVDKSLIGYFEKYYLAKKEDLAKESMLKKIKSMEALVRRFEKKLKKPIQLNDVDSAWMINFEKFMRDNKYGQGYIFRSVKFIKTICRDARESGLETNINLDSIKSKDKKAYKIYLTEEEIEILKDTLLPTESLENARDWLVISCYLGQRVSDLMRCEKGKIKEIDGHKVIDLRQKKTDKAIMIAVFPEVEEFLAKRDGDFPRPISDVKYNKYVKEVCKIAGLNEIIEGSLNDTELNRKIDGFYPKWQLISSHVGRRSFATNYYGKYPTALLMAQTGHTTERAFLEYIGKGQVDQVLQLLKMINK